jgi:hypothetical protein
MTNPRKVKELSQITTLRLYHPAQDLYKEPSHTVLLLVGDWRACVIKMSPCDPDAGFRCGIENLYSMAAAKVWLVDAAEAIEQARGSHPTLLSKLDQVIMTGVGDQIYGTSQDDFDLVDYFGQAPLPHLLLQLPSVQDYCQCNLPVNWLLPT